VLSFFTKPLPQVETVPQVSPGQLLAEVEKDFRLAELDFILACRNVAAHNARHKDIRTAQLGGDICALVNAWTRDPELQKLEAARDQAQRKRNELLHRRAELLTNLGLIK
jgi:hypothetical protein